MNITYPRNLLFAAAFVTAGMTGCHSNQPTITDANNTADPADANLAASDGSIPDGSTQQPVSNGQQASAYVRPMTRAHVLGARAQNEASVQSEEYAGQQAAPIERRAPEDDSEYANQQQPAYANDGSGDAYDQGVQQGMDAVEEADQPPPPLPVYQQPACDDPNSLWTPGYWNYAPAGYYWVPGAWVAAPYAGALWTPGYWGYYSHRYRFHHGFWGPHVGYYGGIPYGFGYTGYGYQGGYWNHDQFQYNRAVNRVNTTRITNVYNRTVIINNNVTYNRISYNGGNGGIQVQPRPAELAAMRETHVPPMQSQLQLRQVAAGNRQQFFAENHGRPADIAVAQPLQAQRGIPPPAVRLASANAPRPTAPAGVQPGRMNGPGQPAVAAQPMQRVTTRQETQPQGERPFDAQRQAAPNQQRQNVPNQQRQNVPNQQQPAVQQRLNSQVNQQRLAAQRQTPQQRLHSEQGQGNDQQRVDAADQREHQQHLANEQHLSSQQQQHPVAQQRQAVPQPQRPVQQQTRSAQPVAAPTPETVRPQSNFSQPTFTQPRQPEYAPRPAEPRTQPVQPQIALPHPQSVAPRPSAPAGPPPSASHGEAGRPH